MSDTPNFALAYIPIYPAVRDHSPSPSSPVLWNGVGDRGVARRAKPGCGFGGVPLQKPRPLDGELHFCVDFAFCACGFHDVALVGCLDEPVYFIRIHTIIRIRIVGLSKGLSENIGMLIGTPVFQKTQVLVQTLLDYLKADDSIIKRFFNENVRPHKSEARH
ncbi:MAG: hypothetical protein Q7J98_12960 [Kiritimatiellia bacterium]|nr:hypothetical protein [Kiritimatiellia bacterium]